jgi:hypothetical protein
MSALTAHLKGVCLFLSGQLTHYWGKLLSNDLHQDEVSTERDVPLAGAMTTHQK